MPQAHGSVRTTLATGQLLFPPGQPHPGVEPADPMLVLRNTAYLFGRATVETRAILWRHARARQRVWRRRREFQR